MFRTMRKPCIKQRVFALIIKDGVILSTGENHIDDSVNYCPRLKMKSGEGYDICKSFCNQESHAEVDAIKNLKTNNLKGAELHLYGHSYLCDSCVQACYERGIMVAKIPLENKLILIGNKTAKYIDLTTIIWTPFDKNDFSTYPKTAGKYLIHRKGCDKTHFEQFNGSGWSSSNNDCTHYTLITNP